MSAGARQKNGKQKAKRGRPPRWESPGLRDPKERIDQSKGTTRRVRHGHDDDHKLGFYQGALREVIDSAREALSVHLLTGDAFPMDVIPRNDELDDPESENPRRYIKWKKMIDGFFAAALAKNKDALALGKLFLDVMLHSAEGVHTSSNPQDYKWHSYCSM